MRIPVFKVNSTINPACDFTDSSTSDFHPRRSNMIGLRFFADGEFARAAMSRLM
jgi:hypothetical protein